MEVDFQYWELTSHHVMGPLLADVIYLENEILVVSPFCSDKYWGYLFVVLFCLGYGVVVVVVLVCVFFWGGCFFCLFVWAVWFGFFACSSDWKQKFCAVFMLCLSQEFVTILNNHIFQTEFYKVNYVFRH